MHLRSFVGGHVEIVDSQTRLHEAAGLMLKHVIGSLLVVDGDAISGILTEHDLARALAHNPDLEEETVGTWMSDYPTKASPSWTIDEAADMMLVRGFRHMPVLEGDRPVGMVSIKDLMWAIRAPAPPEGGQAD